MLRPPKLCVPEEQDQEQFFEVRTILLPYRPLGHGEHAMAPEVSVNVPLGQVMQLPWLLPFLPGGQAVHAATESRFQRLTVFEKHYTVQYMHECLIYMYNLFYPDRLYILDLQ